LWGHWISSAYHTFFVVDQRNVESGGRNWWQKPIGSGPFKLKSMNKDQIVLAANEHYVGGPPPIAEVRFTLRGGSAMTMYEQGELDAVLVSSTDIERVLDPTNSLNKDLTIVPSLDIWYLAFDNQQKPFDDVKVRQAFAYATNKEGIAKILLQKTVTPAKGILPPGLPGYNEKLQGIPYDPERAKALIAESSYKESKNLPPIVFATSGSGDTDPLAAALTEMYADILGVDIEIHQVDWAHFQEDLYAHKYQMFMLGWVGDYPDPQDFLDVLFHSKSEQNHAGYQSPEVDKLLEQARSEQDREARMRLYQQVEEIIVNEAPWVPIDHGIDYVLIKPYVKDFSVTPQGEYYLTKARLVSP
jgi:oligopeptide transport system substrate-binding protein